MLVLTTLGICTVSCIGWIVFDRLYPSVSSQIKKEFNLDDEIKSASGNTIDGKPQVGEINGFRTFKFNCSIIPCKYIDEDYEEGEMTLTVPEKYKLKHFAIGTDKRSGRVDWVYLGRQYHANKDRSSGCLLIDELWQERLTPKFLSDLLELLETYDHQESVLMYTAHLNNTATVPATT
jgi:hypothetical protein